MGRTQFDLRAEAIEPLERGARALDEGDDYFSVARFRAILYERDVAVADVLVDHRIALDPQGIDALGPHTPQQETRHADRLRVLDGIEQRAAVPCENGRTNGPT